MNKIFFAILFFYFALVSVTELFSQTVTTTITYTGAQPACCNVCGLDYYCIYNTGGCGTTASCYSRTFTDPVPAGNIITAVTVTCYAVCGGTSAVSSVTSSINSVTIGSAGVQAGCNCGGCNTQVMSNSFGCTGISGYTYGGANTLTLCPNGDYCIQRAEITFTYTPGSSSGPGTWTWNGSVNTDWFQPCNWNQNSVPNSLSDVVIPGGTPNAPTISSTGAACYTLTFTGYTVLSITPGSGALSVTKP